jgi:DNA modification methylase
MTTTLHTQLETRSIDTLIPYARNSRTHSDEQVAQVAASIKEFGFTNPVLIDETGGIIAGHGRVLAARKLGLPGVPCLTLHGLTEAQKRAYVIADNKLALNAGWDDAMLALEIKDLQSMDYDLDLLGFNTDDLDELLALGEATPEGETEADAVPEVQAEVVTQPGDVWVLGKHRIMCGDSTDAGSVALLMDGDKAGMVYTDPPYGIAYSSAKYDGVKAQGLSSKRNKAEMIIGDDKEFDPSFLLDMFPKNIEMFVWGYQYYPHRLGRGGIIVWNKKTETQAECAHGDFELCWSRHERNKMCWLQWGGFKNKEKGEDRLHTTQKPVALAKWFFENWGNNCLVIVDLFSGSGTTIIAAEQTGRRCYAMELSPQYVDVAVRRWQQYTGKTATHAMTGQPFPA